MLQDFLLAASNFCRIMPENAQSMQQNWKPWSKTCSRRSHLSNVTDSALMMSLSPLSQMWPWPDLAHEHWARHELRPGEDSDWRGDDSDALPVTIPRLDARAFAVTTLQDCTESGEGMARASNRRTHERRVVARGSLGAQLVKWVVWSKIGIYVSGFITVKLWVLFHLASFCNEGLYERLSFCGPVFFISNILFCHKKF